jgi:hypothetical protein
MKTLLFFVLFFVTLSLTAQDYVKFHPQKILYNSAVIEWEHREVNKSIIIKVGLPMNGEAKHNWFNAPSTLHTYSCEFGYRQYYNKLYAEASVASRTYDWKTVQNIGITDGYLYTTNLGLKAGYQVNWKRIVFDFYAGVELGRCNGRTESFSASLAEADAMYGYISELSKKLPARANVTINRYSKIVESNAPGFGYVKFVGGVAIGLRWN